MSFFQIDKTKLHRIEQKGGFPTEKDLQQLVEDNLEIAFGCRFIATEFFTGKTHAGKIDTLALSEENHPVIIEYKNQKPSTLIDQVLHYWNWLNSHKSDFEIYAKKKLGEHIVCDWSHIRIICIAPEYPKRVKSSAQAIRDQFAGANVELWKYRLYANNTIYMQEVFVGEKATSSKKNSTHHNIQFTSELEVAKLDKHYTFEGHLEGCIETVTNLMNNIREYVMGLDSSIQEAPRKLYIAYRTSKIILSVKIQKDKIVLYIALDKFEIIQPPKCYRDVTEIWHPGMGNSEFKISSKADLEAAKPFIEQAYNKIGG